MPVAMKRCQSPGRTLLCLLLIVCATRASAQVSERGIAEQPRALTQYSFDQWDDRNGLPQNAVQAIAQSADGYLWIGTQSGVARFDGVRFQTFDGSDSPALQRAYVWDMESDGRGGVWIGSEEGGLIHGAAGKFTAFTVEDGLPADWVKALARDRADNLWIGTMGGGLAVRRPDGRFEVIDSARGFPGKYVFAIVEDARGTVWVGYGQGVARIRDGQVRLIELSDKQPAVHALAAKPGGGVYAGVAGVGVALIEDDVARFIATGAQLPATFVRDLAVDDQGAVWVGTAGGIARVDESGVSTFPRGRGPENEIAALHVDNEGSVWIGLEGGGLARMRAMPIVPLGKPEGLSHDMVNPIMEDRSGAMWIGTAGGGVNVFRDGRITNYTVASGHLPDDNVASLAQDHDGAMWVGTYGGMSRIADGKATLFGNNDGLNGPFIRVIHIDRSGALWVGSHGGLQRFRPGPPRLYTTADGLADDFVMTMLEDREGVMWVATRYGVSRFMGDRFKTYTTKDGLPDHGINALYQDRTGTIWLATQDGLARLRAGRIETYSTRDGLCANDLFSILEDDHGRFWFGSSKGIFHVEKAWFGKQRLSCKLYGRAAGMRAREVNGAVNPAAWKARDGRLWFPTIRGVAIVDPHDLGMDLAIPPVHIEGVVAQGRRYSRMPETLPAGVQALEVSFTGLSFVSPDQMQFRYQLEGYDDAWVDAGARRTAYYTNLRPRKYRFRVQAANADGEWNEVGASVSFAIAPRWFETLTFRGALVGLIIGLLWLAYVLRVRGMHQRQQELVALAEEHVRAEARYRELFENATDAVFTTDLDGNFTALNRKAETITGYSRAEALQLNLRALLPRSEAGERMVAQWVNGLADGSERIEIINKHGERVPIEASTRLVAEGGVNVGMQAIARDMADRTALERQLQQAQKMEAVGQLAGGVAHDFNNLLTVIRGNGALLLDELPEGSRSRDDVEQINLAADRAGALTRQLLAFSRKQVVHPIALDLNSLLRDIEKMLQRLIGEDFTLLTLPSVESAFVIADPGQLEQVLVNLVVNARDAMPKGGSITIETSIMTVADLPQSPVRSASGRAVMLVVTDTGIGMDPETQSRIFEPFFTTKGPGKGTGLGLSTVYGIVQQAGGQIVCSSRPGSGTTFSIYLPLAEEGALERRSETQLPIERGSETVLLVEDEDAVRTLASRVLRHHGYHVIEARHGADALSASHDFQGPIDLLLSDVVLPAMNGRVLSEKLLQYRPGLRVMLMSGYTDDEILRRGLLDPGVAYLQKPFTPHLLLRTVRSVLDAELATAEH